MRDQPNFKHYTRGGQISFHNLRMWDQITKTLTMVCLFLWVLLTGVITWLATSTENLQQALAYYYASFLNLIGLKHIFTLPFHGKLYQQTVEAILHFPYYAKNAEAVENSIGRSALIAFGVAVAIGLILAIYFIKRGKAQSESHFFYKVWSE